MRTQLLRVVARGLVFSVLLCCRTAAPTTAPIPREIKARVLSRDILWLWDSLPALRFETPFAYNTLRAQVERCSGLTRADFPRLFVAPVNPMPGNRAASYSADLNLIVFALGAEVSAPIIRHELLHWLLTPITAPEPPYETEEEQTRRFHPVAYFGRYFGTDSVEYGRCGRWLQQ